MPVIGMHTAADGGTDPATRASLTILQALIFCAGVVSDVCNLKRIHLGPGATTSRLVATLPN
jgi:hypothetical protein